MDGGDVYTRCLLKRRVKLAANLQNKHAADSILQLLRVRVEGVCGGDGFIRPRSVSIVDISPGVIELSSLSGHAVYNVKFTADVCNPAIGDVLTCRVENVNSYGVLAVNMSETRVLEVILQREPVSFQHAETLDELEPGDTVTLEVMCRQFKLGQKTITLVGRAVGKDHQPKKAEPDNDDDVDVDVPRDEGEESDDDVTTVPDDESHAAKEHDDAAVIDDDDEDADEDDDDDDDDESEASDVSSVVKT